MNDAIDFVLDTKPDIRFYMPVLLQVLIAQEDSDPPPILLIETTHLPDKSSFMLSLIILRHSEKSTTS